MGNKIDGSRLISERRLSIPSHITETFSFKKNQARISMEAELSFFPKYSSMLGLKLCCGHNSMEKSALRPFHPVPVICG